MFVLTSVRICVASLLVCAIPFLAPARASSQDVPSPAFYAFDRVSLNRELDRIQTKLAEHSQADLIRAALLAELASVQSRLGLVRDAVRTTQSVLSMGIQLPPESLGTSHYILANAIKLLGSEGDAEKEYLAAIKQFSAAGPNARVRLSLTYAELSMHYIEVDDIEGAELCLRKSLAVIPGTENLSPALEVLRTDTSAHIEAGRGHLSNAYKQIRGLLQARAEDPRVPPDLRSHIFRDYSEFCAQDGRIEEAVGSLDKAAVLQEQLGNFGQAAVALAMVGNLNTLRKAYAGADDAFARAEKLLESPGADKPLERSVVRGFHGIYLVSRHDWQAARDQLEDALSASGSRPRFIPFRRKCLEALLTADRCLGHKEEAKSIRAELKGQANNAKPQATVDVMALKRSLR